MNTKQKSKQSIGEEAIGSIVREAIQRIVDSEIKAQRKLLGREVVLQEFHDLKEESLKYSRDAIFQINDAIDRIDKLSSRVDRLERESDERLATALNAGLLHQGLLNELGAHSHADAIRIIRKMKPRIARKAKENK